MTVYDRSEFIGIESLKALHSKTLEQFEEWVAQGNWTEFHIQHYDWWMFPISARSRQHGSRYQVLRSDIDVLKQDEMFIRAYRRAVELVFLAWGWLVHDRTFVAEPATNQSWRGNETRLGKMVHSLRLFGQDDLRLSARDFVASLPADKQPRDPRTTRFL